MLELLMLHFSLVIHPARFICVCVYMHLHDYLISFVLKCYFACETSAITTAQKQ